MFENGETAQDTNQILDKEYTINHYNKHRVRKENVENKFLDQH